MLDKKRTIGIGLLVVMISILLLLPSCGKEEPAADVEEVTEMNKGQAEVTDIKDKLSPETNLDDLQQDVKEFDDW